MQKDRILKLAKGFRGRAKNCIRIARERVEKALQYSYRDRRNKKRDMRSLWIQRINAGTRQHVSVEHPVMFAWFNLVE
ncbi:50s ribosomal protein l20 [Quercus suber]|uniref:50S ribosomal protein L20 n=1 Tax=Quercus suber TaxID=58331 RepID=A0AAW0M2E0_QUESU